MERLRISVLHLLLVLIVISESAVIVRRDVSENGPSGDKNIPLELEKDKKWQGPEIWDSEVGGGDFGMDEYDTEVNNPSAQPSDYDYGKPGPGDSIKPGMKPETIPPDMDRNPESKDEEKEFNESESDEGFFEPFDGEEDSDEATDDDKDSKPSTKDEPTDKDEDEDEKIPNGGDDDGDGEKERVPVNEGGEDDKEPEDERDEDDKKPDEELDEKPDDEYEGNDNEPGDKDDEGTDDEEEETLLSEGSIFDTPFFNLKQVQKYFNQLERAVGFVFRQTLDEARLLNGTFANTTEEEVEIDGKKYIVQKSIIKDEDQDSSIYVEALSSKSKTDDAKGIKDVEKKNETST